MTKVLLIIFSRYAMKFTTPQKFTCWAAVLDIVLNHEDESHIVLQSADTW
jgi:hypothetical protein